MRLSVAIALAAVLGTTAVALVVVPAGRQPTVAGSEGTGGEHYIELEERSAIGSCQPAGTVPAGTTAIRAGVEGIYYSPPATVKLLSGSRVIAEGRHEGGGPAVPNITIPVPRLAHAVAGATLCATVGPAIGAIRYYGVPRHVSGRVSNPLQEATLRMEYLRPGGHSWWSDVSSIGYHLGLGRAPSGSGVGILVLVLMLGAIAAASRLALQELK